MIQSTVDLISGVASNSLFVFCICNLIIAVLLVSGSKSDSPALLSESPYSSSSSSDDEDEECDGSTSPAEELVNSVSGDEECGMCGAAGAMKLTEEAADNSNEEDDDELRRRAEEFIEKINRIWIAENMQQPVSRKAVL